MEMSEKKNETYGAGGRIPSTGGLMGEQAGPGASSSSDCNVKVVEHLATLAENASSEEDLVEKQEKTEDKEIEGEEVRKEEGLVVHHNQDINIFKKSNLLLRSPPRQQHVPRDGLKEVKTDSSTPTRTRKKRKADGSPRTTEDIANEKMLLWKRMESQIKQLSSIIKQHPNVRGDVKKCSEELQSLMVIINQLEEEWAESSNQEVIPEIVPKTSVGSQTDEDLNRRSVDAEEKEVKEVEEEVLPKVNTGNARPYVEDNSLEKEAVMEQDERKENKNPNKSWKGKNNKKGGSQKQEAFGSGSATVMTNNTAAEPNQTDGWRQQISRKERKGARKKDGNEKGSKTLNKKKKVRPDAILIKSNTGKTFAEVLRAVRQQVKPEDTETEILRVRKTKTGDVLLEIGANSSKKSEFGEKLRSIMKDEAVVTCMEPRDTIEIRDLDDATTKEEVEEAIYRETKVNAEDIKTTLLGPNSRGLKLAIIQMSARVANKLVEQSKMKIGWVNCRIRRRLEVKRCFRCFGFGHEQSYCKGPNRRGDHICMNCGEKGHSKSDCSSKEPQCFLCKERQSENISPHHKPGTGKCQVFREALEEARTKAKK